MTFPPSRSIQYSVSELSTKLIFFACEVRTWPFLTCEPSSMTDLIVVAVVLP